LIIFLKSLPLDCFFNVLSFGDKSFFLFQEQSIKSSEASIAYSINEISSFKADLGGTELFNSLKKVFLLKKQDNYPRNVFILTDGDISNTEQVLELIAKNTEQFRVYTIGIGNGCSRQLIIEGANVGKGSYEFIADNEKTNEKIVSLLQASLTPF